MDAASGGNERNVRCGDPACARLEADRLDADVGGTGEVADCQCARRTSWAQRLNPGTLNGVKRALITLKKCT